MNKFFLSIPVRKDAHLSVEKSYTRVVGSTRSNSVTYICVKKQFSRDMRQSIAFEFKHHHKKGENLKKDWFTGYENCECQHMLLLPITYLRRKLLGMRELSKTKKSHAKGFSYEAMNLVGLILTSCKIIVSSVESIGLQNFLHLKLNYWIKNVLWSNIHIERT